MYLSDTVLNDIFTKTHTIAVVGASDRPGRPVDMVGRYLIDKGFTVIPVHPKRETVWGLPARARLTDIQEKVDIVDLFRASEYCPAHAKECLLMAQRPSVFWMQKDIFSRPARDLMEGAGLFVVEGICIKLAYEHYLRQQ